MVFGDNFPDSSSPNTIFYEFRTYHMSLLKNKHVKHDETYIDTQGRFKAIVSNIMDILGRLTSKLHKT